MENPKNPPLLTETIFCAVRPFQGAERIDLFSASYSKNNAEVKAALDDQDHPFRAKESPIIRITSFSVHEILENEPTQAKEQLKINEQPSKDFLTYAQKLAETESKAPHPCPVDVLERSLWASAHFDRFKQSGQVSPLIDGLGLPLSDAAGYQAAIKRAIEQFSAGK
ncbi:MAG: hypothetical protein M0036_18925 [Desulfobacteraceae bacterium]|nr:hypothetical protein [Desulfobacteraceae bacterium]